jgi:uncharacterized protein (PEP-CTERM system associated)
MWGEFSAGDRLVGRRHSGNALWAMLMLMSWHMPVFADQWQLHPTLQLEEIYTDNVTLAPPSQAESDFVTAINPGFRFNGEGGRVKANVSYLSQNFLYANNSSFDSSYQQLAANATAELRKNVFFVDATSSINQQIINPQGLVAVDNINPSSNLMSVITYGVSPYMKLKLDSYVDGELRYKIDQIDYQNANFPAGQQQQYSLLMKSGPGFGRLSWNLGYQQLDLVESTLFDMHTKIATSSIRYHLSHSWNVLAYAGYDDNQVPAGEAISPINGSYWSAGLEWAPSRHITASATTGVNDRTADLMLRPTERTSLHVGYRDQSVGLIVGSTWTADLTHFTRRTTWRASYAEQRTTVQSLEFLGQQNFELQDKQGNVVIDPNTGFPVVLAANVFGLVNGDFISKRSQATVTLNTGKSDVTFAAYNEHRDYSLLPQPISIAGAMASWNWRITSRTHTMLSGSWQRYTQENPNQSNDLWYGNLALVRSLSQLMNVSLGYRYLEANSLFGAADHLENRLTLQLNMQF